MLLKVIPLMRLHFPQSFVQFYKIVSDVEVIDIKDINESYERMLKGDVRYRFVIDMATL